mgnify:FL=1
MEKEFIKIAQPVLQDEKYKKLQTFIQHGRISTYEHSVNVAYTAYCWNLKMHLGIADTEVIYAGLLHDYYLYDWHHHVVHWHGYVHPAIASKNAQRDFHISSACQKAIKTHMWPLTLLHVPSSRLAWLITLADKRCSLEETLFKR